jgi:hypothetical protein
MAKRSGAGVGSVMSNRFEPFAKAFESSAARLDRVATMWAAGSRSPRPTPIAVPQSHAHAFARKHGAVLSFV